MSFTTTINNFFSRFPMLLLETSAKILGDFWAVPFIILFLILFGYGIKIIINKKKSYSFFVILLSLMLVYSLYIGYEIFIENNSDMRSWWPVIIIALFIFSAIISFIMNICFYIFDYNPTKYLWVFVFLFIILNILIPESLLGDHTRLWIIVIFILGNLIWCIVNKIIKGTKSPNSGYKIQLTPKKIIVIMAFLGLIMCTKYWLFPNYAPSLNDKENIAEISPKLYVAPKKSTHENAFIFLQNLPTLTRYWEYFNSNNTDYLLSTTATPNKPGSTQQAFNLFKFDPLRFKFIPDDRLVPNSCNVGERTDWIRMDQVYFWKHFKINNQDALVMANHESIGRNFLSACTRATYWTKSYIFWWEHGRFVHDCASDCMNIPTDSPMMIEFYTIGNDSYFAVAEEDLAGKSGASIYRWNGKEFEKTKQPNLNLPHSAYVESFQDSQNETYLVFSLGGPNEEVMIYQVDKSGQLNLYQSASVTPDIVIAQEGFIKSSLVFKSLDTNGNKQIYLLLGYTDEGFSVAEPWIYRWEFDNKRQRYLFKPYQQLDNAAFKNTGFYAPYTIEGIHYIGAAIGNNGAYGYAWNANLEQLETEYNHLLYPPNANQYVKSLTPFFVTSTDGVSHLLIALAISGSNVDGTPIMRWQSKENRH